MTRFGKSKPGKFSLLDKVDDKDPFTMSDGASGEAIKPSASSPSRRLIQTLGCRGSPRRQLLVEKKERLQSESQAQAPPDETSDTSTSMSQPLSRQIQVDEVIVSVMSSGSSAPRTRPDEVSPSWKIQPTYDDAHVVFSSEDDTNVAIPIEEAFDVHQQPEEISQTVQEKVESPPSKKDDTQVMATLTRPSIATSLEGNPPHLSVDTNAAQDTEPHPLNSIETLLARVKKLDAMIKAGEVEAAGSRAAVEVVASSSGGSHFGSYYFQPVDETQRDSPGDPVVLDKDEAAGSTTKEVIDGSHYLSSAIERTRRDSPVSHVQRSVASSIATVSSFGIPGVTSVNKPLPTPSFPRRKSLAKRLTPHPFFWRTHPRGTFRSYAPNRPKAKLAPLRDGKSSISTALITNPPKALQEITPDSSIVILSSRMLMVKEEEEPSAACWSGDADPVKTRSTVPKESHALEQPNPSSFSLSSPSSHFPNHQLRERIVQIQAPGDANAGTTPYFPELPFSASFRRGGRQGEDEVGESIISNSDSWVAFSETSFR